MWAVSVCWTFSCGDVWSLRMVHESPDLTQTAQLFIESRRGLALVVSAPTTVCPYSYVPNDVRIRQYWSTTQIARNRSPRGCQLSQENKETTPVEVRHKLSRPDSAVMSRREHFPIYRHNNRFFWLLLCLWRSPM